MLSACTILHKRSSVSNRVPDLTALQLGELAVNTADGKIFTKTNSSEIVSFLDSSATPYILDQSLSAINTQYGSNTVTGLFAGVLNGFNNDVSGSGSTVVNGEDNDIESDYSFIGSGLNNKIALTADYGAILGGSNNNLNHTNSFIVGTDITSHAENFTYVNNLSVLGKIYGDGSSLLGVVGGGGGGGSDVSGLSAKWEDTSTVVQSNSTNWGIFGDRYVTTSISTNSINKGTKVFAVSADLSYIPTQDVTIVYDHDISRHMHGTVLDYNNTTGSLTADITSRTGSGTYSDWRINIGGTPTFVDSLVVSNNLSDVADSSVALANLNGVSKTELAGLSGNWQNTYTSYAANSASFFNIVLTLDPLKFVFIGDSTTKNFTVSGTSNSTNASLLEVFVDSVRQEPTLSYTLSADIVKFINAPSLNSRIVIITPNNTTSQLTVIKKHDFVQQTTYSISYAGIASLGVLDSSPSWRITKTTFTDNGSVSATGYKYDSAWSDRLILNYNY